MANQPSSSRAAAKPAAKRKRGGAVLVSPFRKIVSPLRPVRSSGAPVPTDLHLTKPEDPPAA